MGHGKMIVIDFDRKVIVGMCKAKDFSQEFEAFMKDLVNKGK